MNAYCPHCGGITEYTITKPCFCSACGKDMRIAVGTAARQSPKPAVAASSSGEGEEVIEVPNISRAEVEVVVEKPAKVTFGSVFATSRGGGNAPNRAVVVTDPNEAKKMLMADTKPTTRGVTIEED